MIRCFLTTLLSAAAAILPTTAAAEDLRIDFDVVSDVDFDNVSDGLEVSIGKVEVNASDGGIAGYSYFFGDETAIATGGKLRLISNANGFANPIATLLVDINVVNPTEKDLDLSVTVEGAATFAVNQSPKNGTEYSGNGAYLVTNHLGVVQTVAFCGNTVTIDFAEQFDWPTSFSFNMTIPAGFDGHFSVDSITETSGGNPIGDVNCDGAVNLLDVGPFIDVLSGGTFNNQADINRDGQVNLLDVGPFVDLLAGG